MARTSLERLQAHFKWKLPGALRMSDNLLYYPKFLLEAFRLIREGSAAEFDADLHRTPELLTDWGPSLMSYAAQNNRADILPILATAGIAVNALDDFGYSPLSCAADENAVEAANWLLDHGADPNQRRKGDEDEATPFLWACYKGHLEIVRLLLDRGADPSLTCWEPGQKCVKVARDEGNQEVVEFLKSRGLDDEKRNEGGGSSLDVTGAQIIASETARTGSRIRITGDFPSLELLERFPNWENALDEEGIEGQDETTIRPAKDQSLIGEYVPFTAGTVWLNDGRECQAVIEMIDDVSAIQFYLDRFWFRVIRWNGQAGHSVGWEPYIEDWLPEDQRSNPGFSLADAKLFPLRFASRLPFYKTSLPIKLRILPSGGEEVWS